MSKAFSTHLVDGYFDTASVTDYTLVPGTFELATTTFIIPDWTKNLLTEETIWFWFEVSVRDGFRFSYLSMTPGPYFLW